MNPAAYSGKCYDYTRGISTSDKSGHQIEKSNVTTVAICKSAPMTVNQPCDSKNVTYERYATLVLIIATIGVLVDNGYTVVAIRKVALIYPGS